MRKRIVICLPVVVVIGVVAFLVSQPKKGTVEWHKREYETTVRQINEDTLLARLRVYYYRAIDGERKTMSEEQLFSYDAKLSSNYTALLNLGYLAEYTLFLSNRTASDVINQFYREQKLGPLVALRSDDEDVVVVTAPRTEIGAVSNIVRRIDKRGD